MRASEGGRGALHPTPPSLFHGHEIALKKKAVMRAEIENVSTEIKHHKPAEEASLTGIRRKTTGLVEQQGRDPNLWNDARKAQKLWRERQQLTRYQWRQGHASSSSRTISNFIELLAVRTEPRASRVEAMLSGEADGNDTYLEVTLRRRAVRKSPGLGQHASCACTPVGRALGVPRWNSWKSMTAKKRASSRDDAVKGSHALWLADDRNRACTAWFRTPYEATRAATPRSRHLGLSVIDDRSPIDINEK
ncbi:hypothetical protein FQR65_LT20445 [Abscondita terminalis]|nr:hypothetical protein FQR65_LT20445 [Abscondita terminalis]